MGALQGVGVGQLREMASRRAATAAKWREKATGTGTLMVNGGAVVAGAWLGGALDGYMAKDKADDGNTSVLVGAGLFVAGAFMGQPQMVYGGAGMVAHLARDSGVSMGQDWAKEA